MKKTICCVIGLLMVFTLFTSCKNEDEKANTSELISQETETQNFSETESTASTEESNNSKDSSIFNTTTTMTSLSSTLTTKQTTHSVTSTTRPITTSSKTTSTTKPTTTIPTPTDPYEYPKDTPKEVKENSENLFVELYDERDDALKGVAEDSPLRSCYITREATLYNSDLLKSLGVKEIVKMEVDADKSENTLFYEVQITDKDQKSYYLFINEGGVICFVHEGDKNGKMIYADH